MYFIVVKFPVKPEYADTFIEQVRHFTQNTRAEAGNLWFEWSRNVEDPNEFVLVEAFADDDAATTHVNSDHFAAGINTIRPLIEATPRIMSRKIDATGWEEMGELVIA